jgi:ABC-type polysaccharide/polyol phosphate transport system ATPase subunit
MMQMTNEAIIDVQGVSLSIPVYGVESRSLKKTLLSMTSAGRIATNAVSGRTEVEALVDVSLTIRAGDRLGIVGRNGSGKSTLLRLLCGIYEPTRGSVAIRGSIAPLLDIGLGIDDDLSGRENIALRAAILGIPAERLPSIERDVIEFTELGPFIDLPVRTYSSGMRMRVAFAVSSCVDPDILLLDEWISTGDAHFIRKAEDRLNGLIERIKALVVATHAPDVVRHTCNRAIVMDQGRIAFDGAVEDALGFYYSRS